VGGSSLWMWKINSEPIEISFFDSESDMQSFIMNNPEVISCWRIDGNLKTICLLKELKISNGRSGRIDLVGVAKKEKGEGYELRLIELKNKKIGLGEIEQLRRYLDQWKKSNKAKLRVKQWIMKDLKLGLEEKTITKMLKTPVGIIIAPFIGEEVKKARIYRNIRIIRLIRFKSNVSLEQYLIIEDVIGNVTTYAKRQQFSWRDLIEKGLMKIDDTLVISPEEGVKLKAKIDESSIDDRHTRSIIFYKESAEILLEKIKPKVKEISEKYPYMISCIPNLKEGRGISITTATGLVSVAFEGKPTKSFWVPLPYWCVEERKKTLHELFEEYKNKSLGDKK